MDIFKFMDNIKDIVKDVIGNIADNNPDKMKEVTRFFHTIVQKNEIDHCCVYGIKDATIYIVVDSSIWLYQIKMRRKILLKKITEKFSDIKNISFKIGKINAEEKSDN